MLAVQLFDLLTLAHVNELEHFAFPDAIYEDWNHVRYLKWPSSPKLTCRAPTLLASCPRCNRRPVGGCKNSKLLSKKIYLVAFFRNKIRTRIVIFEVGKMSCCFRKSQSIRNLKRIFVKWKIFRYIKGKYEKLMKFFLFLIIVRN